MAINFCLFVERFLVSNDCYETILNVAGILKHFSTFIIQIIKLIINTKRFVEG